MGTTLVRRAFALAWLGWCVPAWAQDAGGYSIDIEFLRPTFGRDAFVGVDVPRVSRSLTFRAGTLLQYQQAPLTLYEAVGGTEIGAVVTNRFSGMVGASLDVDRMTFGVLVPTAANWGSEQPAYAADGFGVGDVGATARWTVLRAPHDALNVGVRGAVILPTGRPESYIGEGRVRFSAGALVAAKLGPVTVASDVGLMTRDAVETPADFTADTQVTWGNAVRLGLPAATRLAISGQLLARSSARRFLQGGADTSLEGLVGLDVYPSRSTTVGIAAGRGFTEGFGTTDFRLVGNLVVTLEPTPEPQPVRKWIKPGPPEPPSRRELTDAPPVAVDAEWHIALPQQLEFEVDTAQLRPSSVPVLDQVADVLNTTPDIAVVAIEGHASQEGDLQHNYELADARARRVWELLLQRGVAYDRIAYRHRGEVDPVQGTFGDDAYTEAQRQANRRVEFLIVHRHGPGQAPDYPARERLPWSGEPVDVVTPSEPPDPLESLDDD